MQMFEYMTVTLTPFEASETPNTGILSLKLNRLGGDGWELVGVVAIPHNGNVLCFLKRPVN